MSRIGEIERGIDEKIPVRFGVNKKNELVRLMYETSIARNIAVRDLFDLDVVRSAIAEGKSGLFARMKALLVEMRYPSMERGDKTRIMPVKIAHDDEECSVWSGELVPKTVFVEKAVRDYPWTVSFIKNFPGVPTIEIDNISSTLQELPGKNEIEGYNSRRENVFVIKGKTSFVKRCPCTKKCVRCGYQILNIGFGCPIDCSYCYLQTYSNIPGLIFPANIEDYLSRIKELDKVTRTRTRIGTGEFTDSLALDKYTGYSAKLIPFFKETKNLVLELKTKAADIPVVMKQVPHDNVVISWSINPEEVANKYEKGAASVKERIEAAEKAAALGYRVGFHFDPIVYLGGWEKHYEKIIDHLFSNKGIRERTAWISLGSLRYTPGLKQIAERRFEENRMFYEGEFYEGADGKFRYPDNMRSEMYEKVVRRIKKHNKSCWVYLCMEPEKMWDKVGLIPGYMEK